MKASSTMQRAAKTVRWSLAALAAGSGLAAAGQPGWSPEGALKVDVDAATGKYAIAMASSDSYVLRAGAAARVDGSWLRASDYPRHEATRSEAVGPLGKAREWQVVCSGMSGKPDLIYHLRAYADQPFGDIQVTVRNTTGKAIHLTDIRSVDAASTDGQVLDLAGPAADERVLSDSWSEDRPGMAIHALADADKRMHRAVGSQLVYNLQSHESLFLGALTSDRFLTVLRLHLGGSSEGAPSVASYEADSTGTTELQLENSLEHSPAVDQVRLNLPVEPGAEISSERLLFSVSKDYHRQLDTYAALIRELHRARTSAPPLMGWWSWTAYYFGLNEGAALTNAQWEAEHLKPLGYNLFHIDEGYQYARGEYTTPNAALFPNGVAAVYRQASHLGLTPGLWTAPFEVSERSWVHRTHPDWLVKNERGEPIHAGTVDAEKDQLYVLDATHPAAQAYLRETYSTLARDWGIRYFKLDFMDDTAIEGYYHQPNTTALEAQRIGLRVIREAIGDDVYLDKDGSAMLNPVGLVDYGRISQDTGHTFSASKEAATGIAARYFMNRNYFVADPDAFTVSTQTIQDQQWHESKKPATLEEAEVSISLAAVSGGMFEIGDNLPSLTKDPERLALIENPDLIEMIKLGKASRPVDLMSYAAEDEQPSIFLLKEDRRQSILTIFDWTEKQRAHTIDLAAIGLPAGGRYEATDVLAGKPQTLNAGVLSIQQPAHSVRVLKIVDAAMPAAPPSVATSHPSEGKSGAALRFSAEGQDGEPVLTCRWDFGDGVTAEGSRVEHAYTEPGEYGVVLTAIGIGGSSAVDRFRVLISGALPTTFDPASILRPASSH